MEGLRIALGFLTVVPVRVMSAEPGALGRAARWFPAVGLGLGAVLAVAHYALLHAVPPLLGAALVVALWAALTGGLHLDGLADSCDGLGASVPPDRRLEIMRDPRLGTFGGIGLIMALILKVTAVAGLTAPAPALLVAPVGARWLLLLVAREPPARPGGLGAAFASGLTGGALAPAALIPFVLTIAGGWRALAALAAAHLIALAIARLARARLGGITGDVLGCTVEAAEIAALVAYNLRIPG